MNVLRHILFIYLSLAIIGTTVFGSEFELSNRYGLGVATGANLSLSAAEKDQRAEEQFAAALWFRYHLTKTWSMEMSYDQLNYNRGAGVGALELSLALKLWAAKRFQFLIEAGAGNVQVKRFPGFVDSSYDAFGARGSLGFEYLLDKKWALGLHIDYHYADVKKERLRELHILAPMLGFTYYFDSNSARN